MMGGYADNVDEWIMFMHIALNKSNGDCDQDLLGCYDHACRWNNSMPLQSLIKNDIVN